MLRVGRIPYLNCEPFFAHLTGVETVPLVPRALGVALRAGALDAGPVSLADALGLGAAVRWLPHGIATPGAAHSVLVFSRRPLADLDGATVAITDETATSVRILRILLEQRYGLRKIDWIDLASDNCSAARPDAVLLIGDAALRARATRAGFEHVADVGAEWTDWTGLPCVFAVWAARGDVDAGQREHLAQALDAALDRGLADLPAIAARRGDTGLDAAEIARYLTHFIYRRGVDEDAAIHEFARRAGFTVSRDAERNA